MRPQRVIQQSHNVGDSCLYILPRSLCEHLSCFHLAGEIHPDQLWCHRIYCWSQYWNLYPVLKWLRFCTLSVTVADILYVQRGSPGVKKTFSAWNAIQNYLKLWSRKLFIKSYEFSTNLTCTRGEGRVSSNEHFKFWLNKFSFLWSLCVRLTGEIQSYSSSQRWAHVPHFLPAAGWSWRAPQM